MPKVPNEFMIEMLQDEAKIQYRGKIFWMALAAISIVLNVILFFI
jgi:hypothetical protein